MENTLSFSFIGEIVAIAYLIRLIFYTFLIVLIVFGVYGYGDALCSVVS